MGVDAALVQSLECGTLRTGNTSLPSSEKFREDRRGVDAPAALLPGFRVRTISATRRRKRGTTVLDTIRFRPIFIAG